MTASASSRAQTPAKANNSCRRTSVRTSKMLQARELCGNLIPFNKGGVTSMRNSKRHKHAILWCGSIRKQKELSDGALGRICMNCRFGSEALPPTPNPKRSCTILRGACEFRYSFALCSLELTHLRDLSCQAERTAIYDFEVLSLVNCLSRIYKFCNTIPSTGCWRRAERFKGDQDDRPN
ncbi:hypothetical protein ACFX13_004490 [Malus domestica]